MSEPRFPHGAIAIIGMAGRFPGANGLDAFWRLLRDGAEALETFSDADLLECGVSPADLADPNYVRRGTVLQDPLMFDAAFFGTAPREAEIMDPQHRLFLECAWEAMEHAGYGPGTSAGVVGVYGGASLNTYLLTQIARNPGLIASVGGYQLMLGNDKDFLCTRVSYKLELRGPSMTVQTACSTSLVAVEVACRALQCGDCDMALAGGVSISFPERSGYRFQEGMILSPDGHCRPFDAGAAGTRPGAGAGIVVLKRLRDALADRDTIHAVIRGIAVNNDGADKIGYTAPSIDGQIEVIATAQALAEVEPGSITYAETHGTATKLGDPIEFAALRAVFAQAAAPAGFCRLGALKANLGHLDAAAGVAGLIKTVLALQHHTVPPMVNFTVPNPALAMADSPFSASPAPSPWHSEGPRRACVSSFGIGGTNAHAVLEEAPLTPSVAGGGEPQLLVISAKTETALERAGERLAAHLAAHPEQDLADIAWTLQVGRQPFAHRRALVASTHAEAVSSLSKRTPSPGTTGTVEGASRPVAFMFSGQGSQYAGMGAALYRTRAVYQEAIDRCAALLEPLLGLDIRTVLFSSEDAALARTELTQPTLFCTQYALAELWRTQGVAPRAMIGHSIGEYTAAVLAGVMSLPDALRVVAARGRLMAAMPAGSMASVFASADAIAGHLAPRVEIAAYNSPALCTIAGPTEAVTATMERLGQARIEAVRLQTSHAFHSAMMDDALRPFMAVLAQISLAPPAIPYISNVTGTWITPDQATSPAYYAEHLRRPVRFADGVGALGADESLFLLEVGPGQTLTGLARSQLPPARTSLIASSLPRPRMRLEELRAVEEAAGRLWMAGVPIRLGATTQGRRRVPLPTYPFERKRFAVAPAATPAITTESESHHPRCYVPTWVRDEAQPGSPPEGTWLVIGDGKALTDAVMSALGRAGFPSVLLPRSGLGLAGQTGQTLAGAIVLSGLDGAGGRDLYALLASLYANLETLARTRPLRLVVATTGAQSIFDEQVADAEAALALGGALVMPAEIARLDVRTVDLPAGTAQEQATILVREIGIASAVAEAAWRGGRRWLRRFDPLELPSGPVKLRAQGRYLITGGFGGMGLSLAVWLARRTQAKLLLTGRRALPDRALWNAGTGLDAWQQAAIAAVKQVEEAGGEVMTLAADAADQPAMTAAITAATQRWGGLDGVVHAAGNPGSGKLALLQDEADLIATLAPKVDGLSVLVELLGGATLDFVALMSSINAVIGVAGASDYAAANAVLDRFAESGAHPPGWRHVVSIGWSAWADVGMAAKRILSTTGSRAAGNEPHVAIPPEAGAEMFGRILASGRRRVVVTSFDLDRAQAAAHEWQQSEPAELAGPAIAQGRPELAAEYDPPDGAIEIRLATIWSELLGVAGIGANDDFFELGGHSLLATRVLSRVSETLGTHLTIRDFFDSPTIRGMAAVIERGRAAVTMPAEHQFADDREEFLL